MKNSQIPGRFTIEQMDTMRQSHTIDQVVSDFKGYNVAMCGMFGPFIRFVENIHIHDPYACDRHNICRGCIREEQKRLMRF